jgi:hypothetical protein
MPSTGCNSSRMLIACIATVSPMPAAMRSASRARETALPRTTPPWST